MPRPHPPSSREENKFGVTSPNLRATSRSMERPMNTTNEYVERVSLDINHIAKSDLPICNLTPTNWKASILSHRPKTSLVPRPSPKSGKRVLCSEWLFLSHGAGSNGIKNAIIAFRHTLHAVCTKVCHFYDCSASVQQRRSLDPASASNKTVVEYLATVSPELELANGSLCKVRPRT